MTRYFRLHPEGEDPQELLEPENQVSEPWGGTDLGPCDKCGGSGRCAFHYDGREWEDMCPTCRGTGEITDSQRHGVSVFPDADGLYRYMLRRDTDMDEALIVELEGKLSGDVDFDADEGAVLVVPTRIVAATPADQERIGELGRQVDRQA